MCLCNSSYILSELNKQFSTKALIPISKFTFLKQKEANCELFKYDLPLDLRIFLENFKYVWAISTCQ